VTPHIEASTGSIFTHQQPDVTVTFRVPEPLQLPELVALPASEAELPASALLARTSGEAPPSSPVRVQ
jgi:hypothetical protein